MEFNEQQQRIIKSIIGAHLISAPVGTGKTTVLTQRVISALEFGIKPEEILCLTFTNRSAEEMASRINQRVGDRTVSEKITIKTFHGFCAYFVRAEAKQIGISTDFVIFDETEQLENINRVLVKHQFAQNYNQREVRDLLEKIYKSRLNELLNSIGCKVSEKSLTADEELVSKEYAQLLAEQNAVDFNELVLLTINALYNETTLKGKWEDRYKFIQVDEFQDTHLSEYMVVKELAKKHKNVSFIGDLDQTIYGWRGSKPFLIADLVRVHFAPVVEMSLEINYRFNPHILGAVSSFLKSFSHPETKKMTSGEVGGQDEKCVEVFNAHNFEQEIFWVIDNIKKIHQQNPQAKSAVLMRGNQRINDVAEIFTQNGIEHVTADKYEFFRRQEVKDVLAYIKILFNPYDLESALRALQRPTRSIGEKTIEDILQVGQSCGLRLSDFLQFKNFQKKEPYENLLKQYQEGRIVVLDTETTGTDPARDDVIQIYAQEIINGKPGKDFHYYIKTAVPVGNSYAVHGITDEFLVKEGKEPAQIFNELKKFINNDVVCGHNVLFDLEMLRQNGQRREVEFVFEEYYDTLDCARRLIQSENYKLNTLATVLKLSSATHSADDDVATTIGLLDYLAKKLLTSVKKRQELFTKYSPKFISLAHQLNEWRQQLPNYRPAQMARKVWEESGLEKYYSTDKEVEKRNASIDILCELFADKDNPEDSAIDALRGVLHFSALHKDIGFLGLEKGKVPIVSIHQVKGLEFDYVFVVGMNEYKFPVYKTKDIEEEKRIFYVALTRARQKIFLSFSSFNEQNRPMGKSEFIDYIDSRFVKFV